MGAIQIKRIYDEPSDSDGYRVLVDRLWPRGVSKVVAHLNEWNKELAPSTESRRWFDHKAERFEEFAMRYKLELNEKEAQLDLLRKKAKTSTVTLLYGARDPQVNHAIVLRDVLMKVK